MTTADKELRRHLARLLSWSDAHVSFDDAVARLPVAARGKVPKGSEHSPWQLLEHLRLAQADILEFCVSRRYVEKQWPRDYWPATAAPPSTRAWNASIAGFRSDRRRLERLALDGRRDLLAPVPAGTGQTLLREIVLAADHAAYHVGQLVAVRRALGHWR
ncbi:MAG: DinB family protein [Vicinamibacteria bacterium]